MNDPTMLALGKLRGKPNEAHAAAVVDRIRLLRSRFGLSRSDIAERLNGFAREVGKWTAEDVQAVVDELGVARGPRQRLDVAEAWDTLSRAYSVRRRPYKDGRAAPARVVRVEGRVIADRDYWLAGLVERTCPRCGARGRVRPGGWGLCCTCMALVEVA